MQVYVAGLPINVNAEGAGAPALLQRLAPFAHSSWAPHVQLLSLRLRDVEGLEAGEGPVKVVREGARFLCRGEGVVGEVNERDADLSVHGGEPALVAALRLACALWLAPRGGLLLHGACVQAGRGAHAFLGPSGAGKSTLSRRLQQAGVHVVADEVTAVRGLHAHAQPFLSHVGDGLLPEGGLALRSLWVLSHSGAGAGPSRRLLAPREAARALLRRIFLPARDPRTLELALDTAARLAAHVPLSELQLPDDARAAQFVLAAISPAPLAAEERA